jgi:autotransporter-associated beta strand protein
VENAAVLRLNANETLGVLAGPGRVRGVVAVRTLTLGVNNESYSFGGVLENDPTLDAGSLNLAKVGTGTLTLTGTNTYTAGTAISGGGVLSVDLIADTGDSRLGYPGAAGAGYIGIREATLRYTGAGSNSTTRYLWLDQSATNNVFDVSQAAAQLHLYPSGGTRNQPWVKQGAGTLTIGAGAWSGATTVSNGTLRLSDVSAFNGNLQVDSTLAITSTIPFATQVALQRDPGRHRHGHQVGRGRVPVHPHQRAGGHAADHAGPGGQRCHQRGLVGLHGGCERVPGRGVGSARGCHPDGCPAWGRPHHQQLRTGWHGGDQYSGAGGERWRRPVHRPYLRQRRGHGRREPGAHRAAQGRCRARRRWAGPWSMRVRPGSATAR